MDELDDLVKEACRLIERGQFLAAHARLCEVADAARRFRSVEVKKLAVCLYAWLTWIDAATQPWTTNRRSGTKGGMLRSLEM